MGARPPTPVNGNLQPCAGKGGPCCVLSRFGRPIDADALKNAASSGALSCTCAMGLMNLAWMAAGGGGRRPYGARTVALVLSIVIWAVRIS